MAHRRHQPGAGGDQIDSLHRQPSLERVAIQPAQGRQRASVGVGAAGTAGWLVVDLQAANLATPVSGQLGPLRPYNQHSVHTLVGQFPPRRRRQAACQARTDDVQAHAERGHAIGGVGRTGRRAAQSQGDLLLSHQVMAARPTQGVPLVSPLGSGAARMTGPPHAFQAVARPEGNQPIAAVTAF